MVAIGNYWAGSCPLSFPLFPTSFHFFPLAGITLRIKIGAVKSLQNGLKNNPVEPGLGESNPDIYCQSGDQETNGHEALSPYELLPILPLVDVAVSVMSLVPSYR